ncbi:uncharacterized protein F54H12.2 [Trichonephila clavipes]|nr:uncharacterized protein F54H12.2 [Trichonephila clavipes]
MSFYITLISDSSKHFFPGNKTSHFTTQLPTPITLNDEWEMGLVDFIYPHTWYNIREDNNLFGFDLGDGKSIARRIPQGFYETIPDILDGMYLEDFKNKIEFHYHPIVKRVKIKTKEHAKVFLHKGFSKLLGFEPGEIKGKVESSYIADPNASFPLIYVYSDLVEPQIVGDVQAPLLKIVKVEGKDGEVVNAHYTRPHYVPVIRRHFQTVEMVLRLHSGELVPFERGRVIAVQWSFLLSGSIFSKGYGIGGWFKRLFRTALPFLTRGAKSVGKEVLKTGTQIVNDLLEGQNLEDAAKHRTKETGRKLAREAIKKADDMLGQGKSIKKKEKDSQNTSFRLKPGKRKDVIFLIRNKMAFLLKDSPECAKSELNLFTLPPTQTVIEKGQWIQFHPIANVTDGGPVEFLISGSGEDYLDLSQTQLYVKAKILKNDGKVLTDDDKIGPVNLFLHSLFSQVDISLNGRNVSSSNNTYPYRAILETILNHGYDSKTSQLSSEIYYKDTAGRMNIYDDDKEPNEGFNKRASLFKKSATVDMIGRLHVDLFNQDRLFT